MMDGRHLSGNIYIVALDSFYVHITENNFTAISINLSTHQSNQTLSSHSLLCWLFGAQFLYPFHSSHKSPRNILLLFDSSAAAQH